MFQGLIIEGISGSGKTAVMESLQTLPFLHQPAGRSRIILTEHHTQRVLEIKEQQGLLQPSDHVYLLNEITTFLESMQQRIAARGWESPTLDEAGLFFVLERFHLTHVFRFTHMKWQYVESIDRRLSQLGTHLCLLTVSDAALEKRLFSRASECWLNYLKQYGNTHAEIVDTFMQRQQLAVILAKKSCLPLIQVDTSFMTIEETMEALFQSLPPKV